MAEKPSAEVTRLRPPRACPICGKPSTREDYPFCSDHCRDRDLHRWLSGNYAIPAVEQDDSEDADGEGTV